LDSQKYNVKEKKSQKLEKIYMKFALKNRAFFFFCKVLVGYKNENERSSRVLKNKKKIFFLI